MSGLGRTGSTPPAHPEPAYVREANRASQTNGRCHFVGAHGHAPVPPCPLNTLKYESIS